MAQEHSKNPAFDAALEKFDSRGGNLASMFQAALNETPWGGEKLEKFTPIIPELNRRLEEAKAEARERPLTTEQVEKLLQEPTTPESGVSITAIEELRAQLLAQLGELDPRNPAYTALLAKISSGSAKELSSLDGEIALAIAESTTEKAFASAEATAAAAAKALEELAHAWKVLEEKQKALDEAMQKAHERGEISDDEYRAYLEKSRLAKITADDATANPNDAAKAARARKAAAAVSTHVGEIIERRPEGSLPDIRAANSGYSQGMARVETAEANLAATEQRDAAEQQRIAAEQQRDAEAGQQRSAKTSYGNDLSNDLFGPSPSMSASTAQPAAAALVNVAATAATIAVAAITAPADSAAPATTIVADATYVDRGATLSNLASPPRPVTVPPPTITAGTRTT